MSLSNISSSQFTYDLLKKGLDATSERGKVIANNIANANTANFKRSYVTFEDTLKNSMGNIEMETTDKRHINNGTSFGDISVEKDASTSVNEDGNNVDMDTEMSDEAENTLEYYALISQANSSISMENSVIEGK